MSASNNTTQLGGILRPFGENNYARAVLGPLHPFLSSLTSKAHQAYTHTIGSEPEVAEQMVCGEMDENGEFEFTLHKPQPPVQPTQKTQPTKPVIVPKQKLKTAEMICLLTGTLFLATVLFGIAQLAGMDLQIMGLIAHIIKNSGIPVWAPVAISLVATLSIGFICAAIENKQRKDSNWENDFPAITYPS